MAWSDQRAFVLGSLRNLYETGKCSDLEVKCEDRVFHVHKLILSFFTDYFEDIDSMWTRLNLELNHVENIFKFMYCGQIVMRYDEMEDFLVACKFLRIRLFKSADVNAEGMNAQQQKEAEPMTFN